jgi:predicted porin
MKKLLLTLAVPGLFAGAAHAQVQANVAIYGSIDGGIRNLTNTNAAGQSKLTIGSNGNYYANRIGFKGTENLDGGLNAHFVLETGFNTGTGTLDNNVNQLFNRSALVGLSGSWGSLELGRQYSIAFKTAIALSPFGFNYMAITPITGAVAGSQVLGTPSATAVAANAGATRFNNDIQYAGTFGPMTARVEYALGEQAGNTRNGAAQALGLGYANGPLSLAGAYTTQRSNMATTAAASWQDRKQWVIAGAYKLGAVRVTLGYIDDKLSSAAAGDRKTENAWGGLEYDINPALALTGGYYQTKVSGGAIGDGKKELYILGGTYALSKRTKFYAEVDNANNIGILMASAQARSTGISVGINHLF